MRSYCIPALTSLFAAVLFSACDGASDGPATPDAASFSVEANPYMATAAIVHAEIEGADSISIEYRTEGEEWNRTPNFSALAGRYPVVGLLPESRYTFRIAGDNSNSGTVGFTTGALPSLPDAAITHPTAGVAPGYYLVGYTGQTLDGKYAAVIYDADGRVVWYRGFGHRITDFQRQANGNFTVCLVEVDGVAWFNEVNLFGDIVARYESEATPESGIHELRLFTDGSRLVYGVERPHANLTSYGGPADAEVKQCVVEYRRGASLFTWRTEKGMTPSDGIDPLDTDRENPYHVNAIDRDTDGNLLISMRNASQIVKVDVETGEVLWRLGGRRDQFLWLGDPLSGFCRQHGIRRLPNGNILLFDNGNEHTPPVSRAVEYSLDEHFKYATLVWEYRDPALFGFAMGFAQRLENGNTLICYGTAQVIREVTSAGEVVLEIKVGGNEVPYRAFKVASLY